MYFKSPAVIPRGFLFLKKTIPLIDPEDISREADRQRKRDSRKKPARKRSRRRKPGIPYSPYGWTIYSRIYARSRWVFPFSFISGALCFIGLLVYWIEVKSPYLLYASLGAGAVFVLQLVIYMAGKILRYGTYKNWTQKMGFTVTGWERLDGSGHFPEGSYWIEGVTIEVVLKKDHTESRKAIADAMYILSKKANGCFYSKDQVQVGYAGDIRDKWRAGDLKATGSADGIVMGVIYDTISRYLYSIHKKYNSIDRVIISYNGKAYNVKPEESMMAP